MVGAYCAWSGAAFETQLWFGAWGCPRKYSGQTGHCLFICFMFVRELWKVQTTEVSMTTYLNLLRGSQAAESDPV